jgi:hypothetical protein
MNSVGEVVDQWQSPRSSRIPIPQYPIPNLRTEQTE